MMLTGSAEVQHTRKAYLVAALSIIYIRLDLPQIETES